VLPAGLTINNCLRE